MRKFKFTQNAYYHICNRSNDEAPVFLDTKDYARFLFFIFAYQSSIPFYNIGRQTSYFAKYSKFNIEPQILEQITKNRNATLTGFTIMPNHFHLLVQEKTDTAYGVSRYLHRIQTGYAKYFNAKYKKRGHLFQGHFQAVPVETDEQLLYLSAYIHRNPRDIKKWRGREIEYPWSSYQDCVKENRWGKLLDPDIILNQFSHPNAYYKFIETSTAKLKPGESPHEDLFLE